MSIKSTYDGLRAGGLSHAGAIGMLCNAMGESGCRSNNAQNSYGFWSEESDIQYTEDVIAGKRDFVNDGVGYGKWQTTHPSRKAALQQFAKSKCVRIDDDAMQTEFAIQELTGKYRALYQYLCATADDYEATARVCVEYERPKMEEDTIAKRYAYRDQILSAIGEAEDSTVKTEYRPILRKGSKGAFVRKAQNLLTAKDYFCGGVDGDFGPATYAAVRNFQTDKHLEVDGIIGPNTWAALEREDATVDDIPSEDTKITAKEARDLVIQIALGEVGMTEKATNEHLYDKYANAGYNNFNKYAYEIDTKWPRFYNGKKNGFWWCDCFADWPFLVAFGFDLALKLLCAPERSCGAGCEYSAGYFRAKGQFHRSNPQPGDQIFFGTYGHEGHVGIVVDVDATTVYTVEGNTSSGSGVDANGGGVYRKQYALTSSYISGYGRPDWSLVEGAVIKDVSTPKTEVTVESKPEPAKTTSNEVITLNVRAIKKGDKGQLVKTAQLLLIGYNYRCGPWGADGDFGDATASAVQAFQRSRQLTADGVVGEMTWNALING